VYCCFCDQGPGTDQATVQQIRDAIKSGEEITVRILNYKRSGVPFWNMFTVAPMKDSDDTIRFFVGVQVGSRRGKPSGVMGSDGTPDFVARGNDGSCLTARGCSNRMSRCLQSCRLLAHSPLSTEGRRW
jgi:hypothetical protein